MSILLAGSAPKPAKARSNELYGRESVIVYHPGYDPPKLLIILVAFEAPSGHCGVPFSVVLDACQILANNRDGTLRVRGVDADLCAPDGECLLLRPGNYTYHVNGESYAVRQLKDLFELVSDVFDAGVTLFVPPSEHGPRPKSCPLTGTSLLWAPTPLTQLRLLQLTARSSRRLTTGVR
jgi:hypothetical protein